MFRTSEARSHTTHAQSLVTLQRITSTNNAGAQTRRHDDVREGDEDEHVRDYDGDDDVRDDDDARGGDDADYIHDIAFYLSKMRLMVPLGSRQCEQSMYIAYEQSLSTCCTGDDWGGKGYRPSHRNIDI